MAVPLRRSAQASLGLCSEEHAVKNVVKAAWVLYQREGGRPCPWQFP